MKRLIFGIVIGGIVGAVLILLIIVIFDTNRKKNQNGLRLVTTDSTKTVEPKKKQMLVYGDYMNLDSTDFLLIPLGMKSEDRGNRVLKIKGSEEDASEDNGSSYQLYKYNFYSLDFGNCNNIIFYNKKTDETHLLLQKPAVISKFYFPYYNKEYIGEKYWFILFSAHEADTNEDGYINIEDAEKVYICNLSGTYMLQINPANTKLVDWYVDAPTNNLLIKVIVDSNEDTKYNYEDETEILKTEICAPAECTPIISKEIKDSIKKILGQIK